MLILLALKLRKLLSMSNGYNAYQQSFLLFIWFRSVDVSETFGNVEVFVYCAIDFGGY